MAIASKSSVSTRKSRVSRSHTTAAQNSGVPISPKRGLTSPLLFSSKPAPLWLLRLCHLQHHFAAITFLLVATMLGTYSWVVYSQKMWTQAYRRLETLQIHERQLTTTNETLKHQALRQAQQPNMGLVPLNPAEAVVLPSTPPRSVSATNTATSNSSQLSDQNELANTTPLGY